MPRCDSALRGHVRLRRVMRPHGRHMRGVRLAHRGPLGGLGDMNGLLLHHCCGLSADDRQDQSNGRQQSSTVEDHGDAPGARVKVQAGGEQNALPT
jgi:hypothetical protein